MSAERPFELRVQPTWRDMDALGHVNNAVYSTWLEMARAAYWQALVGPFDRFPFLLARTEIDFRASVTWKEEVTVRIWVAQMGNSSLHFAYALDTADGRRIAEARTVQVMFDHAAQRKLPLDDGLRKRLEAFEAGPN